MTRITPFKEAPCCILTAFSFVAVATALWLTRWGIGINNDSTVYLASALNLSRGSGLSEWSAAGHLRPMTHFPPLYPAVLALFDKLGFDILTSAKWLNALLLGANIFISGRLSYRLTGGDRSPVITGLLFLFSTHLLLVHMMAISEPLFILLVLLGVWSFIAYIENPGSILKLLLAGATLSLASLCRYIGVAFILAGAIYIVSQIQMMKRSRLLHFLSFLLVSFSGIMLWLIRNLVLSGSSADRMIGVYPIGSLSVLKGLQTILWWLMFERDMNLLGYLRFVLAMMMFGLMLKHWETRVKALAGTKEQPALSRPLTFILLCLAAYMTLLILSLLFFDPAILLDYRILSPVYILLLLLFPLALNGLEFGRLMRSTLAVWMVSAAAYAIWWGQDQTASVKWNAYQRFNWRKLEWLMILDALPESGTYLTNDPELFYALTGKVPSLLNKNKLVGLLNERLPSVPGDTAAIIHLVVFKQKVPKPFLPVLDDIQKVPNLVAIDDSPDIYISRMAP